MEFLVNDLSIAGQFPDLASFRNSIERIMQIRTIAHRFGRELHCHRGIANAQVTASMTMPQAVKVLTIDEQRVLMHWLAQNGPFWDDARNHGADDWLEWNGAIVTDTAVGEAAWCCLNNIDRSLVSFSPSNWQFSPVPVHWVSEPADTKFIEVCNHWVPHLFEGFLQAAPVPLTSWIQLEGLAVARCPRLTFAADAFAPLRGHPFGISPAQRVLFILDKLNQLKSCFDGEGQRTAEGHEVYREFFTGQKGDGGRGPLFTDSSDGEKSQFKSELTFSHPSDASKSIFCTWHGKVQTPQLRVHFSYPIRAEEPLYIVYVGPKITKR